MKFKIAIAALCLFMISACTKSLEIDIVESKCKDFKISLATYDFKNPNCTGTLTSNTLKIGFNYDGDKECLNSIQMNVRFFDANNTQIFPISLTADSLHSSSPNVTISTGKASFNIDFEVATAAIYDNISYVTVNFNTKNENQNESNRLAVVANMPCKTIPPPASTDQTYIVKKEKLTVSIWDNAAEDGDIITIIVNGDIVAENVTIYNSPKSFTFNILPSAKNYIRFYAVNEGTSSPNTASGSINDGVSTQSFNVGMNEGESISFDLVFVP
jgi:hypothetical protein